MVFYKVFYCSTLDASDKSYGSNISSFVILILSQMKTKCLRLAVCCEPQAKCPYYKKTNVASVGSVFSHTRKVKVPSLPETTKGKSTF